MDALDARCVEEFFDVGFFVQPSVFSLEEVEKMRDAFVRMHRIAQGLASSGLVRGAQFVIERSEEGESCAEEVKIHRICWCGAVEPILMETGRDPRILRMVRLLLGSDEADHLINQAHLKLPNDGVFFPWHQDSVHRRYGTAMWRDLNGKGSYVQTVLALDDITEENGPLLFVPGSARLGHLESLVQRGKEPIQELDTDLPFDPNQAIPALMKAGSLAFFGPYTIHASWPNRSLQTRRVLINGYAYPDANARVYPGEGAGERIRLVR
jgi:hypothetical protein